MWTREQLKTRGKAAFLRNYWFCVVAALILSLLVGNSVGNTGRSSDTSTRNYSLSDQVSLSFTTPSDDHSHISDFIINATPIGIARTFVSIFGGLLLVIVILVLVVIQIFVLSLFEIGGARFFIENALEKASLNNMLFGFQNGFYVKNVKTIFLRNLYTALWSLLLVIPGIVKAYEYRMIPYLLADCPELSTEEAFRISREMMDGQKMNAFILDLSFLGWKILSSITCGLVGVFFVNPYEYATNAELFLVLKQNYFSGTNYRTIYQ